MKKKRFQQYLDHKKQGNAIKNKSEIANHSDQKIDEDFKGYPGSPAKENVIKPETATEKKTAAVDVKDGEKMENTGGKDEQYSEGSGGAFGGTESVKD